MSQGAAGRWAQCLEFSCRSKALGISGWKRRLESFMHQMSPVLQDFRLSSPLCYLHTSVACCYFYTKSFLYRLVLLFFVFLNFLCRMPSYPLIFSNSKLLTPSRCQPLITSPRLYSEGAGQLSSMLCCLDLEPAGTWASFSQQEGLLPRLGPSRGTGGFSAPFRGPDLQLPSSWRSQPTPTNSWHYKPDFLAPSGLRIPPITRLTWAL